MARVRWAVHCHATSKRTGRRCRRYAIEGGRVCWNHGGAIGQVRAAARKRLAAWKLERKLGRPLRPTEQAWVTGDTSALRGELDALLTELKADLATERQ